MSAGARRPEVLVIGAGPGGAATAWHLARLGRRVLMLERQRFPRDKSCGDGLTPVAVRLLDEMGVLPSLAGAQEVGGARLFMRGKGSRDFHYPQGGKMPGYGLVVPRLRLDQAICRQAVAAGAELWEGVEVTALVLEGGVVVGVELAAAAGEGERRVLRAPVVVAAHGAGLRFRDEARGPAAGAATAGTTPAGIPSAGTTPTDTTTTAGTAGGMAPDAPDELGFALRGYFTGVADLGPMLEIYMPVVDVTNHTLLPSYGWVFPTGPGAANVGIGLFRRERGSNVRRLCEQFAGELLRADPRFRQARLCGGWLGAPLRHDFCAERCAAPGLLRVGDAAGLVSPFTGEGISYALESGKLAALAIHRALRPGARSTPDLSEYAERLEHRFTGYFEAGRRGGRRYLLTWRILESTFHNERPLFQLCRRGVLFPEGMGEAPAALLPDVGALVERHGLQVREELLAVGELLLDAVRRDWPFLARASAGGAGDPGIQLRPALLLLLAAAAVRSGPAGNQGGREPEACRRTMAVVAAAALELGYLAALAHQSVEAADPLPSGGGRPANWGNMLAVLTGDFLLGRAGELAARVGAKVNHEIAQALAVVATGQVEEELGRWDGRWGGDRDQGGDGGQRGEGGEGGDGCAGRDGGRERQRLVASYLAAIESRIATLFQLPCRLGAQLGGAGVAEVESFTRFGRDAGLAFELAEEALAVTGEDSEIGRDVRGGRDRLPESLPVLLAARSPGSDGETVRRLLGRPARTVERGELWRMVAVTGAHHEVRRLARELAESACAALQPVPAGPARDSLCRLARYGATREAR